MSEQELIELPSGDKLVYVDDDHSYWRWNDKKGSRGRRLTGVTTACKSLDIDPGKLLNWAARTQLLGAATLIDQLGADQAVDLMRDPDACWQELETRQLTYNDVRDKAATEGTRLHKQGFEALASGRPAPDTTDMSEAEQGKAKALQAFFFDHSPKFRVIEQVVFSERLSVAGRLDGLGELTHECENPGCACHDDELLGRDDLILDVKSGGFISAAAHTQVGGGYPLLATESGFTTEPGPGVILKILEDGTYELLRAEGTPTGFEIAVLNYREAGRVTGADRKARKARREAQETVAA